jgi:CheY-like chemotaxis protein
LGDEKRLRQVLVNLLGNAIKFTEQGDVILKVNPVSDDKKIIRFTVEDTGIGIATEHLESIFDPFGQVGDQIRQSRGTGLGLAISQELVELMGGTLQVKSQLDQGSTFWFDIPLPQVADLAQTKNHTNRRIIGVKEWSPKVLIIDDNADNRNVLVEILVPLNFSVAETQDCEDGLIQLESFRPDAIILDLVMPNMSGLEMIKCLRQSSDYDHIPIIVSSASSFEEDQAQSLTAGANVFVPKPVDVTILLNTLHQQLGIEWIYAEQEMEIGTQEAIVYPPAQTISEVVKLARIGDVAAIQQYADDLMQNDPQMKPFAAEIHSFADSFQINGLIAYLDALQE